MNRSNRYASPARHAAALVVLVALAAGAGLALAQSSAPARSRAAAPANGGANGGARSYVPADSGPSPEALRVLDTIEEPIPAGARVAAARSASDSAAADSTARAAADSAVAAASGAASEAPVPEPTQPLGDTTRTLPSYGEPASPEPAAPGTSMPAPPDSAAAAAAAAMPDTCWAVQIASPSERQRAESLREAGESLLLVRMMIEPSRGRFGVRTSDCMTGATADSLRRRALATGFKDAFRVKWVRTVKGK
jgi:hypothetical protein